MLYKGGRTLGSESTFLVHALIKEAEHVLTQIEKESLGANVERKLWSPIQRFDVRSRSCLISSVLDEPLLLWRRGFELPAETEKEVSPGSAISVVFVKERGSRYVPIRGFALNMGLARLAQTRAFRCTEWGDSKSRHSWSYWRRNRTSRSGITVQCG